MSFPVETISVTIANGESLSSAAYIGHGKLVAVVMPDAWTAAGLTFRGSPDGETFRDIYDASGAETAYAVAAAHHVSVDKYEGAPWMKLRSGTGGSPVNQGAARTLVLIVQKFTGLA